MNARGYNILIDGAFGSGTQSAVQAFQANNRLSANGIVDQKTWEALIIQVQNGGSGDAVSAVQSQLNSKGYSTGIDGQFGPQTQSSVQRFQTNQGLTADGIVGPNTWCALVSGSAVG